jgi:hypothetical protein
MATSMFGRELAEKKTQVIHIVIMRKADTAKWNPNKYVFTIDPSNEEIALSDRVYNSYATPADLKSTDLDVARDLIRRFREAKPVGSDNAKAIEEWQKIEGKLGEIVDGEAFRTDVCVYKLSMDTGRLDLINMFQFKKPE